MNLRSESGQLGVDAVVWLVVIALLVLLILALTGHL